MQSKTITQLDQYEAVMDLIHKHWSEGKISEADAWSAYARLMPRVGTLAEKYLTLLANDSAYEEFDDRL